MTKDNLTVVAPLPKHISLFNKIQRDPPCAGFQFAPFGAAVSRSLSDNGEGALTGDLSGNREVYSRTLADVQGFGGNLYQVRNGAG